ncbi:MAG: hypothetical protein ACR2HE_08605 [Casimicrobiaceae bacterium]
MATGKTLNEVAWLGHENGAVILDQHEQTRAGPDAKLVACFWGMTT